MAKKPRISFRWKFVLLFLVSLGLAGTITYLFFVFLQIIYHTYARQGDNLDQMRQVVRRIGDLNAFLLIFIPLAILVFFLLTRKYSIYLQSISAGIDKLAQGEFNFQLPVDGNDEFANLAENINYAAVNLRNAVQTGQLAERSKDKLIVNLAHDLRTPLTSIIGYLELISTRADLSADKMQHFIGIAYNKSKRLEKLIEHLFDLTQFNVGSIRLQYETLDLAQLIEQINDEFFPIYEQHNLEGRLYIEERSLLITADGDLLARVFDNLLNNAVRYGHEGKYIDIHLYPQGDQVITEVINYDGFIEPDRLPFVFDMFYKIDDVRQSASNSTGLGLAIAKNIVDLHKGTITVESSIEQTKFIVSLPRTT